MMTCPTCTRPADKGYLNVAAREACLDPCHGRTSLEAALAEAKTYEIRDTTTGETVGQAPGASDLDALHTFRRDALDGRGSIYQDHTGRICLGRDDDEWTATVGEDDDPPAADLENGPHADDVPVAAQAANADEPQLDLIDKAIATHGLPVGIAEAGDEDLAAALWFHATVALEAELDTEPTNEQIAARIGDTYATLYYGR